MTNDVISRAEGCICDREHDARHVDWFCLVHGAMTWSDWDSYPLKLELCHQLKEVFRRRSTAEASYFHIPISKGLLLTEMGLILTMRKIPRQLRLGCVSFKWAGELTDETGQRWGIIEAKHEYN